MAIIRVPKPPASAYNPKRRAGTLLQHQLLHLEWAARPAKDRKNLPARVKPARTEAEAARRIAALTEQIQRQAREPVVPYPAAAAAATTAQAAGTAARLPPARKPPRKTPTRKTATRKTASKPAARQRTTAMPAPPKPRRPRARR
jgi:hypothetical protein